MRAKILAGFICTLALGSGASALPLTAPASTLIPADTQQIISINYQAALEEGSLAALRASVLPPSLELFLDSLQSVGVSPANDFRQVTFLTLRIPQGGAGLAGIAQGQFPLPAVQKNLASQGVVPSAYRTYSIYTLSGFDFAFVNSQTLIYGSHNAVLYSLDTHDGYYPDLSANAQLQSLIASVSSNPEWAVIDKRGTQQLVLSSLGTSSTQANSFVANLLATDYKLDASSESVRFELDVNTTDSATASTLSAILQAAIQATLATATTAEKPVLRNVVVDTNGTTARLRYQNDDGSLGAFLKSPLFASLK